MDFLKEILVEPTVREYLKDFPESDWKEVVKKTLLYGIHSLKALENLGLTSPKLEKIPALHSELTEMKKQIASVEANLIPHFYDCQDSKRKLESSKENSKMQTRPRGISQKNLRDKGKSGNSAVGRGNSKEPVRQPPFRLTGKEKPEVRRKLPNYLKNIDSKIKDEVQKSRRGIFFPHNKSEKRVEDSERKWEEVHNTDRREKKEAVVNREEFEASNRSNSSFSTYNAAEDVKEFYQKEFSKLLPTSMKGKPKGHSDSRKQIKLFASSPSESDDY
jgi:hypothetical protein